MIEPVYILSDFFHQPRLCHKGNWYWQVTIDFGGVYLLLMLILSLLKAKFIWGILSMLQTKFVFLSLNSESSRVTVSPAVTGITKMRSLGVISSSIFLCPYTQLGNTVSRLSAGPPCSCPFLPQWPASVLPRHLTGLWKKLLISLAGPFLFICSPLYSLNRYFHFPGLVWRVPGSSPQTCRVSSSKGIGQNSWAWHSIPSKVCPYPACQLHLEAHFGVHIDYLLFPEHGHILMPINFVQTVCSPAISKPHLNFKLLFQCYSFHKTFYEHPCKNCFSCNSTAHCLFPETTPLPWCSVHRSLSSLPTTAQPS